MGDTPSDNTAGPNGAGDFYLSRGWERVGAHRTSDGQRLATCTRPAPWPGPDTPASPDRLVSRSTAAARHRPTTSYELRSSVAHAKRSKGLDA